jgi:hypothetical protein
MEESKFVKSRMFTMDDFDKRMEKPLITVAFEAEFDDEDHMWEDTILLPIAAPRVVWKLLFGCAKAAGTTVGDIASEWLSDTAMDMIENMKPLRDQAAKEAGG